MKKIIKSLIFIETLMLLLTPVLSHNTTQAKAQEYLYKENYIQDTSQIWNACYSKIMYNKGASDAAGNMADEYVKYDEAYTVKKCAFTRKGYNFTGWKVTTLNNKYEGESFKLDKVRDGNAIYYTISGSNKKQDIILKKDKNCTLTKLDSEMNIKEHKRQQKILKPDWKAAQEKLKKTLGNKNLQNCMYFQSGQVYIDKDGSKKVTGIWIGRRDYDLHLIATFDYETGKLLKQRSSVDNGKENLYLEYKSGKLFKSIVENQQNLHWGHCNGMTYYDGKFYVGVTEDDKCTKLNQTEFNGHKYNTKKHHVIRLNQNLEYEATYTVDKKDKWENTTGVSVYKDTFYLKSEKKDGYMIYKCNKNGNKNTFEIKGNTSKITNKLGTPVAAQDICVYKNKIFAGSFYNISYNNYMTLIFPKMLDNSKDTVIHPIKLTMGNTSDTNNRFELQDFSVINTDLYILASAKGDRTKSDENWGLIITRCKGDGIPTTVLTAQWEKIK